MQALVKGGGGGGIDVEPGVAYFYFCQQILMELSSGMRENKICECDGKSV